MDTSNLIGLLVSISMVAFAIFSTGMAFGYHKAIREMRKHFQQQVQIQADTIAAQRRIIASLKREYPLQSIHLKESTMTQQDRNLNEPDQGFKDRQASLFVIRVFMLLLFGTAAVAALSLFLSPLRDTTAGTPAPGRWAISPLSCLGASGFVAMLGLGLLMLNALFNGAAETKAHKEALRQKAQEQPAEPDTTQSDIVKAGYREAPMNEVTPPARTAKQHPDRSANRLHFRQKRAHEQLNAEYLMKVTEIQQDRRIPDSARAQAIKEVNRRYQDARQKIEKGIDI